jgi:hypothetical protein
MIFAGCLPMSDSSVMSSTNMQWLPTPYPKGIMHTFEISMSLDTHNPSISLLPLKKVAPVRCSSVVQNSLSQPQAGGVGQSPA